MNSQDTNSNTSTSWFDKNRRKLSGIGYLIGDAALAIEGIINMQRGIKEGDKDARSSGMKELAVGGGFAIGGAAMAKYGKRPVDKQMEALQGKLAAFFEKEGVTLSRDYLERAQRENNKGFFAKLEDFCYRYPTEILNATYGLLSTLLISDGIKEYRKGKLEGKTNVGTLGMGVLIVSGALAGLLIKEKSPEQLAQEGKSGLGATLQKNALAVTGGLYFANNFFTAKSSMERHKRYNSPDNEKDRLRAENPIFKNIWMFRALTAASYVFSNLTLMGSKKGASGDAQLLEDTRTQLIKDVANIIKQQPQKDQETLIQHTADYLADRKELNIGQKGKDELVQKINEALAKQKPQNWVERSNQSSNGVGKSV